MSEYAVYIAGQYDLDQINAQILGEEASFSRFINNRITRHERKSINMAKFKELPAGTIPNDMKLLDISEEPPADMVHVWTGVMVVNDATEAVSAYRAI
ncbi:MAG: hypothetical protein AMJ75_10440 [Phycisphaerae bacterium SM1_79]|nr:MAG: hypothetical protein AMJ75_10440 [Phycisphaerae bacterium SM1_79]